MNFLPDKSHEPVLWRHLQTFKFISDNPIEDIAQQLSASLKAWSKPTPELVSQWLLQEQGISGWFRQGMAVGNACDPSLKGPVIALGVCDHEVAWRFRKLTSLTIPPDAKIRMALLIATPDHVHRLRTLRKAALVFEDREAVLHAARSTSLEDARVIIERLERKLTEKWQGPPR